GHPPRIDDRATVHADDFAIPDPGFGINRFADAAQHTQAAQVVFGRVLLAPLHERPDGGRGGVEDGDRVLLDDVPEAVLVGKVGRALVHDAGGAIGQWAVDDVRVAGDPANVGGTPEDVLLL